MSNLAEKLKKKLDADERDREERAPIEEKRKRACKEDAGAGDRFLMDEDCLFERPFVDEQPIDWGSEYSYTVHRLPTPIPQLRIGADAQLPVWITWPAHPDYARRNAFWTAYARKASQLEGQHAQMAATMNEFTNAASDPRTAELDYAIDPEKVVDLPSATDQQRVPLGEGVEVGSLFNSKGALVLNDQDRGVIKSASEAMATDPELQSAARDTRQVVPLKTAITQISMRAKGLQRASSEYQGLLNRFLSFELNNAAAAVGEKRAELQEQAANIARGVKVVSDLASGIAHALSPGGLGDAIDKLGSVVGEAASSINDEAIADLTRQIGQLEVSASGMIRAAFLEELAGKRAGIEENGAGLVMAKDHALGVLAQRRDTFDTFGAQVAKATSDQPQESRTRVAGMMSAIPLVETVIAKARAVREASQRPDYSVEAGSGLQIASVHNHPSADRFTRGLGEIAAAKRDATAQQTQWEKRRDQLFAVKNTIVGKARSRTMKVE